MKKKWIIIKVDVANNEVYIDGERPAKAIELELLLALSRKR